MALDYSKLSDEELEAIANNDYGKLSDATLEAIAGEPSVSVSQTPPMPAQYAAPAALPATKTFGQNLMAGPATENIRDAAKIAKNVTSWTPNSIMEVASHPISTAKAYVAGHPWANTPIKDLAKKYGGHLIKSAGQAAVAPENIIAAPYMAAGYEMAKIRENPTAPGLESNPYAMMVRGQAPTQGAAGAMNRRQALINMPYGNVTPEQQAQLNKRQQAQQVLNQPPTAQNFIQRMQALADLYGDATP